MKSRKLAPKRPPKPLLPRGSRGVMLVFSGGRWQYRAQVKVDGKKRVGTLRGGYDEAHRDWLRLKADTLRAPREVVTLGEALAALLAEQEQRGRASERSRKSSESTARTLLSAWEHEMPLESITSRELDWYTQAAVARGRGLSTVVQKDMPMLRRCMLLAGVAWPADWVRPKLPRVTMDVLTPEEVRALLERLRQRPAVAGELGLADGLPGRKRRGARGNGAVEQAAAVRTRAARGVDDVGAAKAVPEDAAGGADQLLGKRGDWVAARHHHADLIEFLWLTGLRLGELARLTVGDVDLSRCTIRVRNNKDSGVLGGTVDKVELHEEARDLLARLVARALPDPLKKLLGSDASQRSLIPGGEHYINLVMRRTAARLGEPRLNGRTLRHSFVSAILKTTGDMALTRDLARHRSLSTTTRYVHALETDQRGARAAIAGLLRPGTSP